MTYGSLVNGPQDGAWSLSFAATAFILIYIYIYIQALSNLLNFNV